MKLKVTTQHLYTIAASNPTLFGYINTLAIIQANGRLKTDTSESGVLIYPNIKNDEVPFSLFEEYFDEPLIEASEYPLFLYAPKAILQQDVWEDLPDRIEYGEFQDEITETVKTFLAWGVSENYTNPIFENDTHVVLRTNINGQFLDDSAIGVLIAHNGLEGVEILGVAELNQKLIEFPQEEILP